MPPYPSPTWCRSARRRAAPPCRRTRRRSSPAEPRAFRPAASSTRDPRGDTRMPITPTYPGLYVEEILSNSRTISAAPTSVTVLLAYTHPFKTRPQHYGAAVQIFSFADYEREFGGLFNVDWL